MESKKRSFGEWLSDVLVGIVVGAFWLLKTIPLTTLFVLPSGLFSLFGNDGEIIVSSNWLSWVAVIMLADGYFGHRHAERKEQQMMQDFYRWHADEMEKNKGER